MFRYLKFLWALPITLFGFLILLIALPSRPRMIWLGIGDTKALCAWGGWLEFLLNKHPLGSMLAVTLDMSSLHVMYAKCVFVARMSLSMFVRQNYGE